MTENEKQTEFRRRTSMTTSERQSRAEATHAVAIATIEAESDARRRKTERLKAAREAAES
jgi:hypothetical protein